MNDDSYHMFIYIGNGVGISIGKILTLYLHWYQKYREKWYWSAFNYHRVQSSIIALTNATTECHLS